MTALTARTRFGQALVLYALVAAARLSLGTFSTLPNPTPGNEANQILGIRGLMHPSTVDAALSVARAPLTALVLWPLSLLGDASSFSTLLRVISCACFLGAVALVAATVEELCGDWLAAGIAAVTLASASGLHTSLDRSPFEASGLALASLLMWLTARAHRPDANVRPAFVTGVVLALAQPLLAPLSALALVVLTRRHGRRPYLSIVPLAAAAGVLALDSLLRLDPLGSGSVHSGGSLANLESITGSFQGEIREAVELAWDGRALAAIVFMGLFALGTCAVREDLDDRSRMLGGAILVASASYVATLVPSFLIVLHARAGDIPFTLFVGVQLGVSCVVGIAVAGMSRSSLRSSALGLVTVGMLSMPLLDTRVLG